MSIDDIIRSHTNYIRLHDIPILLELIRPRTPCPCLGDLAWAHGLVELVVSVEVSAPVKVFGPLEVFARIGV